MTKAEQIASAMSPDEFSVLKRMESDCAIAPGAWSISDYEIIERSSGLYRPVFVSRDFGFGHTLTGLGRRVQAAAQAIEARRAETAETGSVHESAVAESDAHKGGES